MDKNMKDNLIIAAKLTAICFTALVLLSFVNAVTFEKIAENEKKAIDNANSQMLEAVGFDKNDLEFIPETFRSTDVDESKTKYFIVKSKTEGEVIGYNVLTVGNGYGGDMSVMVALGKDLEVLNVKLLKNAETPGLGKKAESQKYMEKFMGSNTDDYPFPLKKSQLKPQFQDSVTGATITFSGIAKAADKAIELIKAEL